MSFAKLTQNPVSRILPWCKSWIGQECFPFKITNGSFYLC